MTSLKAISKCPLTILSSLAYFKFPIHCKCFLSYRYFYFSSKSGEYGTKELRRPAPTLLDGKIPGGLGIKAAISVGLFIIQILRLCCDAGFDIMV